MNLLEKNYTKFKWFYTESGKLVIGGKSAEQNDHLLKALKMGKKEMIIMHTSEPGSPFTAIIADPKSVSEKDMEETAIFTGCFSRAWRSGKKQTIVDVFKLSQLHKVPSMKSGTWGVRGKIDKRQVQLHLVLTKQNGFLRAVPALTVKNKRDMFLSFTPGRKDKVEMVKEIRTMLKDSFSSEEVLSALPAGGVEVSAK